MISSPIFFSLVLFKHSLSSFLPLLKSFRRFHQSYPDSFLFIHDNSGDNFSGLLHDIEAVLPSFCFSYQISNNIGFGSAHNSNFRQISLNGNFIFVVVNPDVSFSDTSLLPLMHWVDQNPDCSCVAPLIINSEHHIQYSAKKNPTFLSLLIGRMPILMSLSLFSQYNTYHKNLDNCYTTQIIESSYLSGCFLIIPGHFFASAGGFCEQYFLHLEDADLVRRLSFYGRTLHNPLGKVVHLWARGSHKSFFQTLCLLKSIITYAKIWGMSLW